MRQADKIIFGSIHRLQQKADIHQTLVQAVFDVIRHVIVHIKAYQRVFLRKPADQLGKHTAADSFGRADRDHAAYPGVALQKGLLQPVRQFHDLLSALPEKDAVIRQRQPVFPARRQGRPQFLLQVHDLTAQRRLGDVQQLRRPCDIPFLCRRQKIAQRSFAGVNQAGDKIRACKRCSRLSK